MSDAGSEASAPRVKLSEEQTLVLVELQKLSQVAHAISDELTQILAMLEPDGTATEAQRKAVNAVTAWTQELQRL